MGWGEFERIAQGLRPLAQGHPAADALRDDVARLTPIPGKDLILSLDSLVSGVHFLASDPPESIGEKLVGVTYSDLAAKGGHPFVALSSLALPADCDDDWFLGLTRGLKRAFDHYGGYLIGGDYVSTSGPPCLTLAAIGLIATGAYWPKRSHGCAGDLLYVSGQIGRGGLGLAVARGELGHLAESERADLLNHYRYPCPRLELGQAVYHYAHASCDISDGLLSEVMHIGAASGCGAEIVTSALPLALPARRLLSAGQVTWTQLLSAGDDYELLFAVAPERAHDFERAALLGGRPVSDGPGPVACIGRLTEGAGLRLYDPQGRELAFDYSGWQHA